MTNADLAIIWVSPEEIFPYPENSKYHPPEQITKLANAITKFKFDVPIVVDENSVILKGHARREAAIKAGLEKIPILMRHDLSDDQKKAIRIADNKLAESPWIDEVLALELAELRDVDFDLGLIGFTEEELKALQTQSFEFGENSNDDEDDSTPITEKLIPRCKVGEIWGLNNHRLLCGSSLDPKLVGELLGDRIVTFVWSDPPYGMQCQKKRGKIGSGNKTSRKLDSQKYYPSKNYLPVVGDENTETALTSFAFCSEKWPEAVQIWWGANHYGVPPSPCWLVWDKQNGSTDFADAELAWTNQESAVRIFQHTWNGMLKAGEAFNEARCHPNQKPVELAQWAFEKYGKPDDVVFDPFVGSGCSFLAAQKMGGDRLVLGVEIQLEYCELIMQRWEVKTGQNAQKIS